MEKAVFQRNQNNQATLSIAGSYSTTINSVEVRLTNVINSNIIVNWTSIQTNPSGGVFHGYISNVPGGWYTLDIRGVLNGSPVSYATLDRVGIGEVFIVAGQSNAQGLEGDQGEVGAMDERVVSHNEIKWFDNNAGYCDISYPNYPVFSKIYKDTITNTSSLISKTGLNAWCYGKLGDQLTNRLGVPVVFFNASATATTSRNWKESSDGLPTENVYSNMQYCNIVGVPYLNLKKVLNYYASVFGARAILWHQGEADNYANASGSNYESNMNYVIGKSRSHLGSDIPWVISKASYNYSDIQPDIVSAQQNLGANNANKIFSGPNTDLLGSMFRSDDVHFYGSGLIELANVWNASLDDNFFNNATPIPAKSLPLLSIGCHTNSELHLTAPSGYASYKWVRLDAGNNDLEDVAEAVTQSIDRASGTYRCYLTDVLGNITYTQPITVQNVASVCSCAGSASCNSVTYLSDITPCVANNGDGPVEFDKSNGGGGSTPDGLPMKIKGVTYAKGIGCHANSEIVYKLNGNYGRFITDIGIDDEVGNPPTGTATAYFLVYCDNVLKYQSPLMTVSSSPLKLNIDVTNVNELKLITNIGPDNFNYDHTDWAGARVHCLDFLSPSAPTNLAEGQIGQNCATINWAASTDNMEVEKYYIYRYGILIDSVNAPLTSYKAIGLNPLTFYTFRVLAKDYTGNISSQSNELEVVTQQNLVISTSKKLINVGQTSSLTAFGCNGGTINWSNGMLGGSINVSPSDTTIYSATCTIGTCTSAASKDTVKVIPNCKSQYSLTSPSNNKSGSSINLTFTASQTITANNVISSQAKITYDARHSITLLPGFQATSGTVFKALAIGCDNGSRVGTEKTSSIEIPTSSKPESSSEGSKRH